MVTSARFLYWPRALFVWLLAPFLLHHLLLLLLAHCFPPLALAPPTWAPTPLVPGAASFLSPQKIR